MIAVVAVAMALRWTAAPPAIASAGGFTLGATSIELFARRHGDGYKSAGMHGTSARVWYDQTNHVILRADGNAHLPSGEEVVESLQVFWQPKLTVGEPIGLGPGQIMWDGVGSVTNHTRNQATITPRPGQTPPSIRLAPAEAGLLAKIKPSMTRSQIEKALSVKLSGDVAHATGLISYPSLTGRTFPRYSDWQVKFEFDDKGRMQTAWMSAD